ncbi:MAG: agmatine deiminase family protein [Planctomycetota bacterium]
MPAEWEPHEGTWLSWPHNPRTWVRNFGPIPAVFIQIVGALCEYENVHISVSNSLSEVAVRKLLRDARLDSASIHFYHIPTNDAWARDHGPIFIVRDASIQKKKNQVVQSLLDFQITENADAELIEATSPLEAELSPLAVIDWKFNSWGEKYAPWDDDDVVPEKVAEILKLPCFHPRMVLEGGSIDVNGKGTLLTTESVLLNPNRNPMMSRKQIESRLDEYLAARQVIWLSGGIVGDDTDGHIDDLARFVNANTVVAMVEDDPQDENYRVLRENLERLQSATDQDGKKLEIVKLPAPGKVFFGASDERLPASYANFYIGNGSVLSPIFGHANDSLALGILSEFFADKKVIGIDCRDLVGGYGAIHCVTQQQPMIS